MVTWVQFKQEVKTTERPSKINEIMESIRRACQSLKQQIVQVRWKISVLGHWAQMHVL
jgi:hypothetical protein